MIRRWSDNVFAAYTGGDMWGGRMLGLCESRTEAVSLVDTFVGRLAEIGNARTSLDGLGGEILDGIARRERANAQPPDLTPFRRRTGRGPHGQS